MPFKVLHILLFAINMIRIYSKKGIIPNAKYFSPLPTIYYPVRIPEIDQPINDSIERWREMVKRRNLCPFTHTFRDTINVERSSEASDWIKHAYKLVESPDLDSTILVFSNLDLPDFDFDRRVFQTVPCNEVNNSLFGPQLEEFQNLLENGNIRSKRIQIQYLGVINFSWTFLSIHIQ